MRYWLIAAALILLLLGDIATTVIFTEAGLPESNQNLVPIAGSVVDQLIYKAPFAFGLLLLIIGGAKVCERCIKGTGVYAWGPVLLLYSIPVLHNCLVIANI